MLKCLWNRQASSEVVSTRMAADKHGVYAYALQQFERHLSLTNGQGCYGLAAEYDAVRHNSPSLPTECARLSENKEKNRYFNVLPYDYNRITVNGGQEYINASLITSGPKNDANDLQWAYIATQGPLINTACDFWRMVMEAKSAAVIMLTNTIEGRRVKCSEYYPTAVGEKFKLGGIEVVCEGMEDLNEDVTMRQMSITMTDGNGSSTQWQTRHFHYHRWPDHGVPTDTLGVRLLSRALDPHRGSGTTIVHCSAGIGRTGCFCTIDIILQRLQHLSQSATSPPAAAVDAAINIPNTVLLLRAQRSGMVQTPDQYIFIYAALIEELKQLVST